MESVEACVKDIEKNQFKCIGLSFDGDSYFRSKISNNKILDITLRIQETYNKGGKPNYFDILPDVTNNTSKPDDSHFSKRMTSRILDKNRLNTTFNNTPLVLEVE